MKKVLVFWSLLLLITEGFGQNRFSIAPTLGYTFGGGGGDGEALLPIGGVFHYTRNTQEAFIGLTTRYTISSHWDISLGLIYSRLSATEKYQYLQRDIILNDLGENSNYIQLPILFNYRLSRARLSPYISAGVSLWNRHVLLLKEGIKTNALVGIGVDYQFNSKLSLLIQPIGSYLLAGYKDETVTYDVTEINTYPLHLVFKLDTYRAYSVGLQTQFIWRF